MTPEIPGTSVPCLNSDNIKSWPITPCCAFHFTDIWIFQIMECKISQPCLFYYSIIHTSCYPLTLHTCANYPLHITPFESPLPPTSSCVLCLVYKLLSMYVFNILNLTLTHFYLTYVSTLETLYSEIHNLHPRTLAFLLISKCPLKKVMLQSRLISRSWLHVLLEILTHIVIGWCRTWAEINVKTLHNSVFWFPLSSAMHCLITL